MSGYSDGRKPIRPDDREQKRKQSLQRRVLQHLKRYGPVQYDNLSLLFDPHRTRGTAQTVEALKRGHYVEISQDRRVGITESGLRLLAEEP